MLKLRSWIDRSVTGEDKDAKDLAVAAFWYRESPVVAERLWDTERGITLLESVGFDVPLAAAQLLGEDAVAVLTPSARADLRERWADSSAQLFARSFVLPAGGPRDFDPARREEIVEYLSRGIANPSPRPATPS